MSSNPGTGNQRYFCINLLYNLHHVLKLKIISSLSQFHNYYCISYQVFSTFSSPMNYNTFLLKTVVPFSPFLLNTVFVHLRSLHYVTKRAKKCFVTSDRARERATHSILFIYNFFRLLSDYSVTRWLDYFSTFDHLQR